MGTTLISPTTTRLISSIGHSIEYSIVTILAPYITLLSTPQMLHAYVITAVTLVFLILCYWIIRSVLFYKQASQPFTLYEILPLQTTKLSALSTSLLFTSIHELARPQHLIEKIFNINLPYAFELVSSKDKGIRYIVRIPTDDAEIFKKHVLSYLPGTTVTTIEDYIPKVATGHIPHVSEFTLAHHFVYPLRKQTTLEEVDPIAYITGALTKLSQNDLVSIQILVTPLDKSRIRDIQTVSQLIYANRDLKSTLHSLHNQSLPIQLVQGLLAITLRILMLPVGIMVFLFSNGNEGPFLPLPNNSMEKTQNAYQKELEEQIKGKIDQQLFTVTLRLVTSVQRKQDEKQIERGLLSALASFGNSQYQSIVRNHIVQLPVIQRMSYWLYSNRLASVFGTSILSMSEVADIYHFPFTATTKTENMVKLHYRELPAPLSLKQSRTLDVYFGKNTYGNTNTDIGLTDDDRSRHVYIIGQTGSGKSTVMYHMASDDINKGRGVAVIDPHGDLAEDLLAIVPEHRMNDCIYFNPFDVRYPIGINLLELTPGLEADELEQEKELVCESVISVFRRVFSKDEHTDAHRIEYILRNTIYTAFTIEGATIFTIYDLLNDPKFQKSATKHLVDENLQNFWKNEFGRAGNYQVVKMASGVTAKVGRFLFSPTARRILEQPRSTINFDEILSSGKILICNLAEGKLGEDTSQLLGTTVIAKLQQAAMRRIRMNKSVRSPFYIFIDEFQNFATSYFTKLLSGGRKFGLRLTIAEQSTSQQDDRNIVNVILSNTGTVICFRTASPIDEQIMLQQFSPYVEQGDIVNLPRYKFYMKLSAVEPEEPFSGETLPMKLTRDEEKINQLIESSRKNYAISYIKPKSRTAHVELKQESMNIVSDAGSIGSLI